MSAVHTLAMLALAVAHQAGSAQPLEFKGLPFGSDQAAVEAKFPDARCTLTSTQRTMCFFTDPTYAGERVERLTLELIDGTLQRAGVAFKSDSFDNIVAALKTKYGKPGRTEESVITTVGGARAKNTFLAWKLADGGAISIARYSNSISTGYLLIQSAIAAAAENAREADRTRRAKDDI